MRSSDVNERGLADMEARLKARMDAMNGRLGDRMTALDARLGKMSTSRNVLNGVGEEGCGRESNYAALGARADVVGVDRVFVDYIQPSKAEMVQLFEYARRAPVVQDNGVYAGIMNRARFEYLVDSKTDAKSDKVNANAGIDTAGEPVIRVFGGAARIGRVAALSIAAMKYGGDESAAKRFIGTLSRSQCHTFTINDAIQVVNDAGLVGALRNDRVVVNARTISAGLMLGIIAHEAGHLSLGHCATKVNYYATNLEVARNREREADSFSSSVIASSPFGESILEGTLLWHFVLACHEGSAQETTHPLSRERLENIVRANKDLARSLGIELAGG